jgi:peptidoglycan hydrolase-like protein with peptidoglycan-binding domain
MTSELNFEAAPFEYFGETGEVASEASSGEAEQYMTSHGSHHHGGSHHHHRHHRRGHRFGAAQWPFASSSMDAWSPDDGDDDSQPPGDEGDPEAEAEFRNRHGHSNWRGGRHRSGRHQGGQQSFPFDSSPFGAFDNSQFEPGAFELEGETRIREHRRQGPHWRRAQPVAGPWRERTHTAPVGPQWRGNFDPSSPWAGRHHWRRGSSADSYGWPRWNAVNGAHRPRYPRSRWWLSPVIKEPYGGPGAPDIGAPDSYPAGGGSAPSEYMRWAQAALNDVLGSQLLTTGVADAQTRSAIRAFQQQRGLPADGAIGPDTEHALSAARAASSQSAGAAGGGAPPGAGGPPDASGSSQPGAGAADPNAGGGAQQQPPPQPSPAAAPATSEFEFEWENYAAVNSASAGVLVGCAPEPGEVATSHSEAGFLAKEVEENDRGILVADFGIDWRSVKERAKAELSPFIRKLETDPTISEIWIYGYTDCIGPGDATYHKWLRMERARRVFNLLGPIARSKVQSVGPATLGSHFVSNADRVGRARNRSVLIVYKRIINADEERIQGTPCQDRLMHQAQQGLRSSRTIDPAVKARLQIAINAATAGRDNSFIRPGSTSWMFPFRWFSITDYFKGLCDQLRGGKPSDQALERKLTELDQDIVNGLEAFNHARGTEWGDRKALLDRDFTGPLNALMRNKSQSVYAGY